MNNKENTKRKSNWTEGGNVVLLKEYGKNKHMVQTKFNQADITNVPRQKRNLAVKQTQDDLRSTDRIQQKLGCFNKMTNVNV